MRTHIPGRFWSPVLFVVVLSTVLFGACQSESEPDGNSSIGSVHPQEAFLPHSDDVDHTVRRDTTSMDGLASALAAALQRAGDTIGIRDGNGPELFGRISDVALDAEGRILVLDAENREVRIFESDGAFVGAFGSRGEGPGEFRSPDHMVLLEDGHLLVEDPGRPQIFEPKETTFRHLAQVEVPFGAYGACTLEEKIYLQGLSAETPEHGIHVYSRAGERLRSFGPAYEAPDEFLRTQMTRGSLACDRATGTIVFAFTYGPLVYGFAPDGTLRWTTRLTDLEVSPADYVRKGGRRGLHYRREPGMGFVTSLVDAPGPGILAQTLEAPPEQSGSGAARHVIHTYLLGAPTGAGQYVGSISKDGRYPAMVHAVTNDRLLWAHQSPFPRVDVHDVGDVEWSLGVSAGE